MNYKGEMSKKSSIASITAKSSSIFTLAFLRASERNFFSSDNLLIEAAVRLDLSLLLM